MKVGLISGGWDLMHVNHVKTLRMVKQDCDFLVVNVLSDDRMKYKKGENRPIIPIQERMEVLRELRCVDKVICIPGPMYPLYTAIDKIMPDIVFINIDEKSDLSQEIPVLAERGIELKQIHRIDDGVSTTKLLERLRGK